MNPWISGLNTFFGAGITSAVIGYLAANVDPLIASILWTYPFTIIVPLYFMHKSNKSNKYISNYLLTQTYTMILLLVIVYSMSYYIGIAEKKDGIMIPLGKGTLVWAIASVIYYIIFKKFVEKKTI